MSSVGEAEEKEELHVIHDLTFGDIEVWTSGRKQVETTASGRGGYVNAYKDWKRIPKCALAGVLTELIKRIIGLRAKYSTGNGSYFRRWMPRAGRGFSGRVSIGGPADLRPAVGIWVPREPGMVG